MSALQWELTEGKGTAARSNPKSARGASPRRAAHPKVTSGQQLAAPPTRRQVAPAVSAGRQLRRDGEAMQSTNRSTAQPSVGQRKQAKAEASRPKRVQGCARQSSAPSVGSALKVSPAAGPSVLTTVSTVCSAEGVRTEVLRPTSAVPDSNGWVPIQDYVHDWAIGDVELPPVKRAGSKADLGPTGFDNSNTGAGFAGNKTNVAGGATGSHASSTNRHSASTRKSNHQLRLQNQRLYQELTQAKSMLERHTYQFEEARAERDRRVQHSEALEAVVCQLQEQLRESTEKTRTLEKHVASVHPGIVDTSSQQTVDPSVSTLDGSNFEPTGSCTSPDGVWEEDDFEVKPSDHKAAEQRVEEESVTTELNEEAEVLYDSSPSQSQSMLGSTHHLDVFGGNTGCSGNGQKCQQNAPANDQPMMCSRKVGDALQTESRQEGADSTIIAPHDESTVDSADEGASVPQMENSKAELERSWDFVVQGQLEVEEQAELVHKGVACFPGDAMDRIRARGVACACLKGHRTGAAVPNQDDFLLAMRAPVQQGRVALYGVFEGHGPAGHHCSAFVRGHLPECIFADPDLFSRPKAVLRRCFLRTQEVLMKQDFDLHMSGTTATVTLVLDIRRSETHCGIDPKGTDESDTWAFVAHVGDSRAILASRGDDCPLEEANDISAYTVTALTREHRPEDPAESHRVKQQGGEVRTVNSSGAARVFAPGSNRPFLALTRALGDAVAGGCGVIAEPEVSAYHLRPGSDMFLVLGTDGLFEFFSSREVVGRLLQGGVTTSVLEDICEEAGQRWAANSYNQTVDDASMVAVSLSTHFG